MISRCVTWKKAGTEQGLKQVLKRIAYGTRYGHAGFNELMVLDQLTLQLYLEEVAEIVREENRTTR